MTTVTNSKDLQAIINKKIQLAVEESIKEAKEKLQSLIETEFYNQYTPKQYRRTFKFYRSPAYQMINETIGEVFLNLNYNYLEISALEQAQMASEGWHGGHIQKEGRFWDSFKEYCDKEFKVVLKNNLKKQGLNIR